MNRRYYNSIDEVLSRLEHFQPTGDGYIARCPAHDDITPSLSIAVTEDHKVLMNCHAGCDLEEILDSIGLAVQDLFPSLPMGSRKNVLRGPVPGRSKRRIATSQKTATPACDWSMSFFEQACSSPLRATLAHELEIEVDALDNFRIGYHSDNDGPFHAIPETTAAGLTTAILRRYANGTKRVMRGGVRGLVIPKSWRFRIGYLLVVEGFSDTVVLDYCGYRVVGRPSANTGVALISEVIRRFDLNPIIIAENDRKPDGLWPGRDGATTIASALTAEHNIEVPVILPPGGFKDARTLYVEYAHPGIQKWLGHSPYQSPFRIH